MELRTGQVGEEGASSVFSLRPLHACAVPGTTPGGMPATVHFLGSDMCQYGACLLLLGAGKSLGAAVPRSMHVHYMTPTVKVTEHYH